MPLAGSYAALKAGISNAFNLQSAATPDLKATILTNAIASSLPTGINTVTTLPPVPGGFAATQAQLKNAFSLDLAATPDTVSTIMAAAISILAPDVIPAGLPALGPQLKNALTLDKAASPDSVAGIMASAIIAYYTACGVV